LTRKIRNKTKNEVVGLAFVAIDTTLQQQALHAQKVFNYLMKTNNKVIIDQYSMDLMKMYEPEKLQNVLERFILVKHAEGCWVYTPKN